MADIRRKLKLVLDKALKRRVERESQDALKKGTDPKKPNKNLKKIEGGLGRLKKAAIAVGSALAVAFGVRAIIRFGKEAVRVAAEADGVWSRLAGTLENVGVRFQDVQGEINRTARSFQDATKVGDEDFARILTELIGITGDYRQAMENVDVVIDLAAAKQIDFKTAAQLVGRALIGETALLKRYGIIVEEGGDAIQVMRDRFGGLAEEEGKSLEGRIARLNNEWADFKQAVGEAIVEAGEGVSVLTTLSETLQTAAEWVSENRIQLNRMAAAAVSATTAIGRFLNKWLSRLDPMAEFARQQMAVINNLETEEELIEKRLQLAGEIREAIALQEMAQERADASEGVRKEVAEERVDELEDEIRVRQDLIRVINQMEAALRREGSTRGSSGGGGSEGQEGAVAGDGFRPSGGPSDLALETMRRVRSIGPVIGGMTEEELEEHQERIEDFYHSIIPGAQAAAAGVTQAWAEAFGLLLEGFDNVGAAAEALARGLGASLLAGLGGYAQGKVSENVALAVEEVAKGLAAQANPFTAPLAPLHFAAAKQHGIAAVKWAALAGAASAGGSAISGGRGGGGAPRGAAGADSRVRGEPAGPEINIFIDPLRANDPAFQRVVLGGVQAAQERFGSAGRVNIRPRSRP